jgi:protease-4
VRAIVLRVDSPGGSASASDAIWRELVITRNERKDRPLVVSMSDLAASGGYYIAMPAQVIVAEPSTLTGSIGIFGGKFVTGGVYEKLGANIESTSVWPPRGNQRPGASLQRRGSEEAAGAAAVLLRSVRGEGRRVTPQHAGEDRRAGAGAGLDRTAGQGERLVDELGGLDRAVAVAKQRAKIAADSDVELVVYPPRKSFYELLSEQFSGGSESAQSAAVTAWLSANLSSGEIEALRIMRGPFAMFRRGEPLALLPFTFVR